MRRRTYIWVSISVLLLAAAGAMLWLPEFSRPSGNSERPERVYTRVAVDASVYRGLMEMLGVGENCVYSTTDMRPDFERIAKAKPDLLMVSAYDGMDLGKYERLGIHIIECRDFMETSPLGRAGWMKEYGRLWGVGERADSLYRATEERYKAAADSVRLAHDASVHASPAVLFDLLYGNLWYQPSEKSTTGRLVIDAGGTLPFHIRQEGGSLPLAKEQVLKAAQEADVWLIRYYGEDSLTLQEMAAANPVYPQFKAFKSGNVWGCNTSKTPYFEETPFRPDLLLHDIIAILHPEMRNGESLRYFHKLNEK